MTDCSFSQTDPLLRGIDGATAGAPCLAESSSHPNLMSCSMSLQVGKWPAELQSTAWVSRPGHNLSSQQRRCLRSWHWGWLTDAEETSLSSAACCRPGRSSQQAKCRWRQRSLCFWWGGG